MCRRNMKRNKKKFGHCVYCGKYKVLTSDHIPPKNLFPKPRPNNLITVHACKNCNEGASKDDEYFRLMLSMKDDVYTQPGVEQLWQTSYRGLKRPTKQGMVRSLSKNFQYGPTYNQSGIYLGCKGTYNVDLERLDRVIERIIKGLFFHHYGKPLPKEYSAKSFSVDGLIDHSVWKLPDTKLILKEIKRYRSINIGDNVFAYKFFRLQEDENVTFWLITFYSRVNFLGFTLKESDIQKNSPPLRVETIS